MYLTSVRYKDPANTAVLVLFDANCHSRFRGNDKFSYIELTLLTVQPRKQQRSTLYGWSDAALDNGDMLLVQNAVTTTVRRPFQTGVQPCVTRNHEVATPSRQVAAPRSRKMSGPGL